MSDYSIFELGNGTIQLLVALGLIAFAPVLAGWVSVLLGRLAARRERRRGVRQVRAALRTMGYAELPAHLDSTSLLDDSPHGPLPKEWRAPCGEVIHLQPTNDRGPKAA